MLTEEEFSKFMRDSYDEWKGIGLSMQENEVDSWYLETRLRCRGDQNIAYVTTLLKYRVFWETDPTFNPEISISFVYLEELKYEDFLKAVATCERQSAQNLKTITDNLVTLQNKPRTFV